MPYLNHGRGFSLLILLFTCAIMSAQENTRVLKLFIYPRPETIMVGDSTLKYSNQIALSEGSHQLKIWAPSYKLLDTTLFIEGGGTQSFYYEMQHSADYYAYEETYARFNKKRNLHYTLPLISTGLMLGVTSLAYFQAHTAYNELNSSLETYKFATLQLDERYADYQAASDRYRSRRTFFYVSAGLTAVSGYFLYKGIKWTRANTPGEFIPAKNPLISSLRIQPASLPHRAYGLSLCLKLNP